MGLQAVARLRVIDGDHRMSVLFGGFSALFPLLLQSYSKCGKTVLPISHP